MYMNYDDVLVYLVEKLKTFMSRMGTMYAWFQRLAQGRCGPCSKIPYKVVEFLKKYMYTTAQWTQLEGSE
jgi:hypothetical protein